MSGQGNSRRGLNVGLAVLAAVVVAVIVLIAVSNDPTPVGTSTLEPGDAESIAPAAAAPAPGEPVSERYEGRLISPGATSAAQDVHEFAAALAPGRLALECSYSQQGVNPSLRFTLGLLGESEEWDDVAEDGCNATVEAMVTSETRARAIVFSGGAPSVCACDFTLTLSFTPATSS